MLLFSREVGNRSQWIEWLWVVTTSECIHWPEIKYPISLLKNTPSPYDFADFVDRCWISEQGRQPRGDPRIRIRKRED